MKRFLIATSMLAFTAAPAFADDPQTYQDDQTPPATTDMPETDEPIFDDQDDDTDLMDNDDLTDDEDLFDQDADDTWDEAELDEGFTDDHDWIDQDVYSSDGEELGDVERVRLSAAGEVEAIVVETGGVVEVGGREVLIENGEFELTSATEDDEMRVTLTVDASGFAALPDFDEDRASDYPLSDNPVEDDETDHGDDYSDDMDVMEDDEIADPSNR